MWRSKELIIASLPQRMRVSVRMVINWYVIARPPSTVAALPIPTHALVVPLRLLNYPLTHHALLLTTITQPHRMIYILTKFNFN